MEVKVNGQLNASPLYPRGKSPGTNSIGRWVGSRASLHEVAKRKNAIIVPAGKRTPAGAKNFHFFNRVSEAICKNRNRL